MWPCRLAGASNGDATLCQRPSEGGPDVDPETLEVTAAALAGHGLRGSNLAGHRARRRRRAVAVSWT